MTQNKADNFSQECDFDYFDTSPVGHYMQFSESFDFQSPTPNMTFSQTTFQTHLEQQPDTTTLESIPITTTSSTSSSNSRERYHWSLQEEAAYKEFIQKHDQLFLGNDSKKRRKLKIFVEMSDYIGTRSDTQCKSHHQKTFEKYQQQLQQQLQKKLQDDEAHQSIKQKEDSWLLHLVLNIIKHHPSDDNLTAINQCIQYIKQLPRNSNFSNLQMLEQNQSQNIFN